MLKNAFFSVFSKKGGDTIHLCMVSNFKKCEKRNPVEKFLVTEHWGWILLWITVLSWLNPETNVFKIFISVYHCYWIKKRGHNSERINRAWDNSFTENFSKNLTLAQKCQNKNNKKWPYSNLKIRWKEIFGTDQFFQLLIYNVLALWDK